MVFSFQIANGDCYFTKECKALSVPLIATPIPSFKEQGFEEGKNCWYVPFDMNDMNVNRFINILEYDGEIIEDRWNKELVKSKSKYKYIDNIRVKATMKYYDTLEKRNIDKDEIVYCDEERAMQIVNAGVGVIVK